MAVAPIFYDTRQSLLRSMRLGELPSGESGQYIIDRAMQLAQVKIDEALGSSRIAALLVTPYVETPTIGASAEFERLRAQLLEATAVHLHITDLLTQMSMDGNAGGMQFFESEAPFRLSDPESRSEQRDLLTKQFQQLIDDLTSSDASDGVRGEAVGGGCPSDASMPAPLIGGSLAASGSAYFDMSRYRWTFDQYGRYVDSSPAVR